MRVLSLFDGMSCGQVALERLGIKVDQYFASEIDKYAIQITKKNFPNTIHIGDVSEVKGEDYQGIDLLIGGSPCQGFSFAGKQLNFEDPRSKLFFEFVRILEEAKPKYFLLENVKMKKEFKDMITNLLGVEPIEINSALVSAQNRRRLFWTNIPNIQQPEDKGILLKDVLETGVKSLKDKSQTILSTIHKENAKSMLKRKKFGLLAQSVLKPIRVGQYGSGGQGQRIYSTEGKSCTLNANSGGKGGNTGLYQMDGETYRKLTPLECERLQTLPDHYTEGVSNTQRYKMIGNGWTVDVIAHIFKGIK